MRFNVPVIILSALVAVGFSSCDSGYEEELQLQDLSLSNVEVKGFNLLSNFGTEDYDSLSFSVDLIAGRIYNADSLPVGTQLKKALVSLDLPLVSKAEIVMHYNQDDKEDVVVDYLKSSTDSVDFEADKVSVRIVSANQTVRREYPVTVNIHKLKPDSLYWDALPYCSVPGVVRGAVASRTAKMGGKFYTITQLPSGANLSIGDNFAEADEWSIESVTLPTGAVIASFSATDNALFIIDGDDKLYTSEDGKDWSDTGESMCYIYGGYGATLLGVKNGNGKYFHVTYPASIETEVPQTCPVSGTSNLILYTSEWSDNPMVAFTGGKDADGNLSGSTWGYDGSVWAKLTLNPIPPVEGASVCSYYSVSSTLFSTSTTPMLYAFGGRDEYGSVSNKVYVSIDRGVHWAVGNANIQITSSVPKLVGAQAIVCDKTLLVPSAATTQSRSVKPLTSWECPYIYLVGGNMSSGTFNQNIYRGVINFLAFIPIQ